MDRSRRSLYPSGAASASAAYRYTGDTLPEASFLCLSSLRDCGILSNSSGVWGRDSLYGYDPAFCVVNGEERHQPQASRFLPQNGDFGGAYITPHADLQSRLHDSEFLTRPYLTDYRVFDRDTRVSHDRPVPTDGCSFDFLSEETNMRSYGHVPDDRMRSLYFDKEVERTLNTCPQIPLKKRKTPSLDEIIKETWELHSLFRKGLSISSNVSENRKDYILTRDKQGKPSQNTTISELERSSWDKSVPQEPLLDKSWDVATNSGLFNHAGSWMELSAPIHEQKGATSNKKLKESLPSLDVEQVQHVLDLQRLISARATAFMGNHSDDDQDSDSVDSEDDIPTVTTDSPDDSKSREEETFEFFSQMFGENKEMQKMYSEQCHIGRFECLVCSSIPGKPIKKYNGLVSMVMHASKIVRTKKKQEHRGYARALCAAMGWDLCKLPTMQSSLGIDPRCCIPTNEKEETIA